jgi:hypothetical protein
MKKMSMAMPMDEATHVEELAKQMMTLMCESEADLSGCARAALYVMCAAWATSEYTTADIEDQLRGAIKNLIEKNREAIDELETVN